ncbi:hypothetical protein [Mucilaginibacter auburnensis]|uniref:GLPGLI family protein n=1 Tax=Mucilaginibacter auburnensis TaxID=1457233 RepID=A0A2H9VVP1_9SPHI|nr:hypothetical protein [Mucilaginibacter auburnensis]PJJ84887.1 hypothetical protein CLV57_1909 [Mucilaginibacter auburnensis]
MTKFYLPLTAFFVVVLCSYSNAQQLPDSAAYNATLAYYTESVGEQSELFSGYEYHEVRVNIGSVFFKDNKEWTMASLVYNGNVYKNVPLLYDAFSDLTVSKRPNGPIKFVIIPEKVSSFHLGSHHFVRISASEVKNATKERFYEELYAGKSSVIAKRSKTRSEILTKDEGLKIAFENDDAIYIKKDGQYMPIKSRGDMLKLFNNKADALKAYIKSAALNFGAGKEEAFAKLANYYDQISL